MAKAFSIASWNVEHFGKSKKNSEIPILSSATIEQNGTMLAGQKIESFDTSLEHHNFLAIGMKAHAFLYQIQYLQKQMQRSIAYL